MDVDAILPRTLVDSRIRFEPVAADLPKGRQLAEWLTATQDEVLIEQFGMRVLVRGTDEVLVDVDDGADTALLGPLLYGFVVRTLLLHGGTFSLHATAVRQPEAVVAIAGHSGAGKSTTATALARFHGAALLVDDVVPARVVDGRPQVQVFERPVHLSVDALERFGLDGSDDLSVLVDGPRGKLALPATQFGAIAGAAPWIDLDRLVALSVIDGEVDPRDGRPDPATGVLVREVSGADRLRWIVRLSNVTGLASLGDRSHDYFAWSTGLADSLPMVNVVRPEGVDTLDEVCTAVLASNRPRDAGSVRLGR